ncbi:indole-3-acetic acid inducible 29 [Euphorbia peplus]|nr:indole-3-acetic acid inducible 29 [Euphorbia peplus]
MEVQLDLSLGLGYPVNGFGSKEVLGSSYDRGFERFVLEKKRSFLEVNCDSTSQTLSLLPWSCSDDDEHRKKKTPSCSLSMNDGVMEEGEELVGWPPIKSWRKKALHHHQQHQQHGNINHNHNLNNDNDERHGGGSNSMYVKVKMEGVAISRKINLRLFNSYQTLTRFLIDMFPKCQHDVEEEEENGRVYTLTYQDKDGDWLLAGDVPWQTFIESVQRLELHRNGR